jgi:hypothetical protein
VHRQPTFSLTLRVPCRNVGGHGEEDALALELERLAPNVMCSTQKNGIKLKGKGTELLAQNQQLPGTDWEHIKVNNKLNWKILLPSLFFTCYWLVYF